MASLAKKLRKKLGLGLAYQDKRKDGTQERWDLIVAHLDDVDRSLIDIGCNLGVFTARAAALGKLSIGVEPNAQFVRRASRRYRDHPGVGFVQFEVTPNSIAALPEVDVTFCMSVFHYWVEIYGEDAAWDIVEKLLRKSKRKFFFEPASIYKKYGANRPEFIELDEKSISDYVRKKFQPLLNDGQELLCLGSTSCLGNEKFRMLFVVK